MAAIVRRSGIGPICFTIKCIKGIFNETKLVKQNYLLTKPLPKLKILTKYLTMLGDLSPCSVNTLTYSPDSRGIDMLRTCQTKQFSTFVMNSITCRRLVLIRYFAGRRPRRPHLVTSTA